MTANYKPVKPARLFGVHAAPGSWHKLLLGLLPFLLIIALYAYASHARQLDNPDDKLLPGFSQMVEAMQPLVLEPSPRNGQYVFWADTLSSLTRLALGAGLAFICALWLGLNMGAFRGLEAAASPFITFISMIPPLALLPMLFITLGVDEVGKVALIFIGTFPLMTRDVFIATKAIPREQLVKTLTLGGTQLAYLYRIALPQVMPRALDTFRLSLGAAWLFLIAAEAIASTDGLGYRIFLVRRYLAMDIIIPYVAWITLLGFLLDWALRMLSRRLYPWYAGVNSK
ncbi:ABC transporter permease [Rheinheimera sp.]|uniref:ABC transporter permease n=1 Tax=Rheinheimera sp. TaxID=1869214 RepID=UPI002733416C|nr:ABC transporter permease [Rheinheimera sp.]MDP2714138.1 ABC transporter permease [Rheinheimera sp.]